MELANNILGKYKNNISSLILIPSSDGAFEVTLQDRLIFSKKEVGRFPEFSEIDSEI